MKDNVYEELKWSSDHVTENDTSQAKLKTSLRELYETDAVFKASAKSMLKSDPDFQDAVTAAKKGACRNDGTCAASSVAPSTLLYDGTFSVTLRHDTETDRVLYTRAGITREVRTERCDANDTVSQLCDLAPLLATTDGVTTLTEKAHTYRMEMDGYDLLVYNSLETRNADECPVRLCEHNAAQCPSSFCSVDPSGTCVP
jgi:hypothetical protein